MSQLMDSLKLKNFYFMSPVKTATAELGTGKITPALMDYYIRRAKGGVGAIILEPVAVLPSGKEHPKQLMLENDENKSLLNQLIDQLHSYETKVFVHLNHAGRAANPMASKTTPLAPSLLECPMSSQTSEILTTEQAKEMEEAFIEKAFIAKSAGADGIEIQFGHGYLVSQFISAKLNKREDEYGKNRFLFAENILKGIKEKVSIPLILRISGKEFTENITEEDEKELLLLADKYGVSAIHVGWGNACETPPWYYNHMSLPLNVMDEKLEDLRKKTNLPIIAAGRMQLEDRYKKLIDSNIIDGVVLGRQLIVDPDFVNRVLQKENFIRCAGCLQGCLTSVKAGSPVSCIANPEASRDLIPLEKSSHTAAIVGGGPAGLYAGLYLARKGLKVTLFEKENRLGGQWNLAYKVPGKNYMKDTLDDIIKIAHEMIDIKTGVDVNINYFRENSYDEIIIATGAHPARIDIPGLEEYYTGFDVYARPDEISGNQILIIGGGFIGMESAEILLKKGKQVTVVEMLDEIAAGMDPIGKALLMKQISGKVDILTASRVLHFENSYALIQKKDTEEKIGPFDSVVMAVGTVSENHLYNELTENKIKAHLIGDAKQVARIMEASLDAYITVKKIAG